MFLQALKDEAGGISAAIGHAEEAGWTTYNMDKNHTIASWRTREVGSSKYLAEGTYTQTITVDGRHSFSRIGGCALGNGTVIYGVTGDDILFDNYTTTYTDEYGVEHTEYGNARELIWEFEEIDNRDEGIPDGKYSVKTNGMNNAYLQNDNQRVYQYKSAPGDGTGKSEDPKESQTRGIIDDEGYRYVVRGVGSRVTFDLSAVFLYCKITFQPYFFS